MKRAECITPLSSNPDDQLRQLQSAFRILAKPEHELREQAAKLRQEVSSTWESWAAQGKWFPRPTIIARREARELKGVCWPQQGMLDLLGYHVGETQPTPREIRRFILEYAFECHLPPLNDINYFLAWGKPRTEQRLKKLAITLATLKRDRDPRSYATAIDDWEGDLVFSAREILRPLVPFQVARN